MQFRRYVAPILFFGFLNTAVYGHSQVIPAATEGRLPLTVGAGISNYNADWANQRINGEGLWIDYYPAFVPRTLYGLGLDFEAHDLSWGRGQGLPSQFRQDTAEGGAIYSWHHYHSFRPYVKGGVGFGSFDFGNGTTCCYNHDTRALFTMGAGLDVHITGHLWARGDYEYQKWQVLGAIGPGNPTPNGFTFGAMYDFRRFYSEK